MKMRSDFLLKASMEVQLRMLVGRDTRESRALLGAALALAAATQRHT